jgi:circadian clock protein KaiC
VLTGSARKSQEAREAAARLARQQEIELRQRELERRRETLEARIGDLRREFEAEQDEMQRLIAQEQLREDVLSEDRQRMAISRRADAPRPGGSRSTAPEGHA